MLPIHKLSIPTPYNVGAVHVYLLASDPLTLIDTGPFIGEAKEALHEGLKQVGVDIRDIKRIFITHGHPDHYGMAQYIKELSGAEVFIHESERRKTRFFRHYFQEREYMLKQVGIPDEIVAKVRAIQEANNYAQSLKDPVNLLKGCEKFSYPGFSVEVIFLPGHTAGHIGFFIPETGTLFAGDHLLRDITPNPVMECSYNSASSRCKSLKHYIDGLKKLQTLPVNEVKVMHGPPINDYQKVIERNLKHHAKRLETIKKILAEKRWTIYELSREMYPEISEDQIFLAISEIVAHIDFLMDEGWVREFREGEKYYFHAVEASLKT